MKTRDKSMMLDGDVRKRKLYLAFVETCQMMGTFPGGREGMLVIMVVGLAGMDGKCVNVSSIADALGMSRRNVKRKLDILLDAGLIRQEIGGRGKVMYCRCTDETVNRHRNEFVDALYEIWHRHIGVPTR